jgi:hypothetical protein
MNSFVYAHREHVRNAAGKYKPMSLLQFFKLAFSLTKGRQG